MTGEGGGEIRLGAPPGEGGPVPSMPVEVCNGLVKRWMLPRFVLTARPVSGRGAEGGETPPPSSPGGASGSAAVAGGGGLAFRRGSGVIARSYDDLKL